MNTEHRRLIKIKHDYLIENLSFDVLKPLLRESKMFNKYMWDDLKTMSDVLDLLPSRGPEAFQIFIDVLSKAGYYKEVNALESSHSPIISPPSDETRSANSYYEMSTERLGYCLIINNLDFDLREGETNYFERKDGFDADVKPLRNFFEKAEFKVMGEKNLTAEKMESRLQAFSREDFKVVDSMILIILSYGSQTVVYGTDGQPLKKSEILEKFNNKNCQTLQNKPKIIFFVCCQSGIGYKVPNTSPRESIDGENDMPKCTDIYIFNFTIPNEYSVLDTKIGSDFCQVLMSVLEKFYLRHDLETMMKIFNNKLKERLPDIIAHSDYHGDRKRIMLCRRK